MTALYGLQQVLSFGERKQKSASGQWEFRKLQNSSHHFDFVIGNKEKKIVMIDDFTMTL